MNEWEPKLKSYAHFDGHISKKQAIELALNPARVSQHTFYPFIRFHQRWTKFADKGLKGKIKERPIRYAARADAYIMSYYRHLLAGAYEERLQLLGLSESVSAYRRVLNDKNHGKCNIHFALDAVLKVRAYENCCVIALDISSFFESLDHNILKDIWCETLGVTRLPPDHYAVFKAVTSYAVIDREALYERLGYYGVKGYTKTGAEIKGYLKSPAEIPTKLTTGKEFRREIAGGNGKPSLIDKNRKPYGIPQGAPISDLLANLYLLHFDEAVKARVEALNGNYYRYSDDILIVVPTSVASATALEDWVRNTITQFGPKLKIKAEKSAIFQFEQSGTNQNWQRISGEQGTNGLEYLGFRYDGKQMFLRDSTLSNFLRKITNSAKRSAYYAARRYPGKTATEILEVFDIDEFVQRYGRVEDFEDKADDVRNWTFWTYAVRSSHILGALGRPIFKQIKRKREVIRERILSALVESVARRDAK